MFAAIGIEIDDEGRQQRGRLWRLEAFARKDQAAWEAFLGALDGAPSVIVSDADKALACAIDTVFATTAPEHRLCEWHLGRKLRDHLPDSLLADHAHPVTRALPAAFHGPAQWQQLTDAIALEHAGGLHSPLTLTVNWLAAYGPRIEAQTVTRDPRGPHSTGAVEQVLHELDRRLGDRAGSFTNRARMAKLLALMTLELNGRADPRRWADQLRERLYLAGGRPANQRPPRRPQRQLLPDRLNSSHTLPHIGLP